MSVSQDFSSRESRYKRDKDFFAIPMPIRHHQRGVFQETENKYKTMDRTETEEIPEANVQSRVQSLSELSMPTVAIQVDQ